MKIVCYGDSNTYGYDPRALIDNRYPPEHRWVNILASKTGWNCMNQGLNGREIPREGIPVAADADLLVIMLGTNDILQGNSIDAVVARMKQFLSQLTFPRSRTLLICPPPIEVGVWVPDQSTADHSRDLSDRYRSLAGEIGVDFADAGEWGIKMAYDGVHFTEEGQLAFANGLLHHINTTRGETVCLLSE